MSDLSREELQAILREQNELRLRLVALDRKIELLVFESPIRSGSVAPVKESVEKKEVLGWEANPSQPPPLPLGTNKGPLPQGASAPAFAPAPAIAKSSWEFQLGTVWLVRIGIVMLLTGLVFLGNYAYHHIVPRLGPWVKLAMLYFLGGGLAWTGARLEKGAESLRNYGRVLLAGGVALVYYTTYGATFVDPLRVIGSPLVGGLLLLSVGGVVVWLAEKRQAQSVALMAILLSYYTSAINPLGVFSLYSSLLLTVAAVYFLLRHRWTTISFLSLVGTYGSYAFWSFYRSGRLPDSVWQGPIFLLCYWVLFTAAVFLSRAPQFPAEKRTPFLTINNAAFFGLVFQILHATHPAWTGRFSLVFGIVLLALAWFAKRRQTEDLFLDGAYLVQGLGVLTFGLLTELSGYQLSLALALQGTLMLFSINRRHGGIFEMAAGLVTLIAVTLELTNRDGLAHGQAMGWSLTGILIADAWLIKNYKKRTVLPTFGWQAASYGLLAVLEMGQLILTYASATSHELYFCAATLVLLLIGTTIRLRELAITGQFFVLVAASSFIQNGFLRNNSAPTWLAVIFTPLLLLHWWQRQKEHDPGQLGQTLFSALFLATASRWIYDHSSGVQLGFYLGCLALGALLYGSFFRILILALLGQILMLGTAGLFFFDILLQNEPVSWFPLLTLLLFIINERMIKSRFSYTIFPNAVRRSLIVIALSGFWIECNRGIELSGSHFPKTLAWALLGTVALGFGLALRERTYRICGLILLALATLRIFLNDIWGLDPIFRILSFIVLGGVLLLLGFIYNKFADKFKEWL